VQIIQLHLQLSPSSPLFHSLGILKLNDVMHLNNCMFMYDFYSNNLPSIFHYFFIPISHVHTYRTRLTSKDSFYIAKIRTNYGRFNICYIGANIWNKINDEFKRSSRSGFKKQIKDQILKTY